MPDERVGDDEEDLDCEAADDERLAADVVGEVATEEPAEAAAQAPKRNATPSSESLAPSSSMAQMPTKLQTDEKASALANETASTGRRAGSTSSPQIRRNRRAGSRIEGW